MNQIDLTGRRAVVTGGSRGIGRAITQRLLQSGARVSVWALEDAALQDCRDLLAAYGAVHTHGVDVSNEMEVERALRGSLAVMGGVDILVNSAGISGPHLPVWEMQTQDWRRVLDVNLTSAFLCCRAVIPHMLEAKYGRIVNVASVAGKEGSPLLGAYSASKAGMIGLTKVLGKELATSGILVNAVTPGPTRTEMTANTPPEQVKAMVERVPMQRMMEPEEVAAAVAWLVSRDCSFTTGSILDLSGGRAGH
jgi:2-dehydro-3-deoxy-L-rhamnonate dehydrogenase (NAD+)